MDDNVVPLRKKKESSKKKGSFLLWLILLLLLLVGFLYFILGQSKIRYVSVSGTYHYSREEVIEMVGIDETTTVMDIFMNRNQSYKLLPYIEGVSIHYDSFNSVVVEVDEKDVTSYIPFQNQYVALDKDGYIVGYEHDKGVDLPSIKGLMLPSAVVGQQVDVDPMVLSALLELFHLQHKYNVPLTEIEFVNGSASMIHCIAGDVVIVFGPSTDLDRKMRSAKEVLEKLDESATGTLDIQQVSDRYIFKEALGIELYVAHKQMFYALNNHREIVKISPNRLLEKPLIVGLVFDESHLNDELTLPDEQWVLLESVLHAFEKKDLWPVTLTIHTKSMEVLWGNVTFDIGDGDGVDEKLALAMPTIEGIELDASGTIDLSELLETYTFVKNEE